MVNVYVICLGVSFCKVEVFSVYSYGHASMVNLFKQLSFFNNVCMIKMTFKMFFPKTKHLLEIQQHINIYLFLFIKMAVNIFVITGSTLKKIKFETHRNPPKEHCFTTTSSFNEKCFQLLIKPLI